MGDTKSSSIKEALSKALKILYLYLKSTNNKILLDQA